MGWFLRKERSRSKTVASPPGAKDRRAGYREPTRDVRALLIPPAGAAAEVALQDISPLGLSFRSDVRLVTGNPISIRLTSSEARNLVLGMLIRGEVLWIRYVRRDKAPWECGMRFWPLSLQEHLSLIRFLLEEYGLKFSSPDEKRSSLRLSLHVAIPIQLETAEGVTVRGHLKDISSNGLGLMTEVPMVKGERLMLSMRTSEKAWVDCELVIQRIRSRAGRGYEIGAAFRCLGEAEKAGLVESLTRMGRPPLPEEPTTEPIRHLLPWTPAAALRHMPDGAASDDPASGW